MFATASVFHLKRKLDTGDIHQLLLETGYQTSLHTWHGLYLTVPQVRFTSGCDICIQIDDEPEEIAEEAQELALAAATQGADPDLVRRLRQADSRIDIMPFQPDASRLQYEEMIATGVRAQVPQAATLENPNVMRIARSLADCVDGVLYDNVADSLIAR